MHSQDPNERSGVLAGEPPQETPDRPPCPVDDRPRDPQSAGKEHAEPVGADARIMTLSRILRGLGSAALIGSTTVFVVQRWQAGNDIQRYLTLLAYSAFLPVAAFFCGLRIREEKGARTLFAVQLVTVPLHFAILGGLLYSKLAWDDPLSAIPGFALWVAPTEVAATLTTAGALALLLPLSFLAFLALARSASKSLTFAFLVANALLLVPVRSPDAVALLIAVGVAILSFGELRRWRGKAPLRTLEGRLARSMLWIPLALLAVRTLRMYEVSRLFQASLLGSAAFLLFAVVPLALKKRVSREGCQVFSTVPAGAAWWLVAEALAMRFDLPHGVGIPLYAVPYAGILVLMSTMAYGRKMGYHWAAAVVATVSVTANVLMFPSVFSSLCCSIVAVACLCYGFIVADRLLCVAGMGGAVLGLGYNVYCAIQFYSLSSWSALAILGVCIILVGSLLERRIDAIKQHLAAVRRRFATDPDDPSCSSPQGRPRFRVCT